MNAPPYLAEIGLLLYPNAQLAATQGLTDLFTVADRLARERLGGSAPLLRISHFACAEDKTTPARVFDTHSQAPGDPNAIVIPPSLADPLTAAGLMAWTDLGLTVVARLLGPEVMRQTARFLLVDPPAGASRQQGFSPPLSHGDAAILSVQQWLQREGTRKVTIAAMAAEANLEPRTFLRRFSKATGYKPTEYCQHQRVDDAREMLVATLHAVDQIAWNVGYGDPASFRKVFAKLTGLSPRDYRRRFRPQESA